MKSAKVIALASISTAFCVVLLIIGAYFPAFDLSCLFMSSICVTLPLVKGSYKGAFLTYLASSLLSLLFVSSNFAVVICFAVFFGLHPILNYYLINKYKNSVNFFTLIKVLWFIGLCFLMYYLLTMFTFEYEIYEKYVVLFLIIGGGILGFIYDIACIRFLKASIIIAKRLKL